MKASATNRLTFIFGGKRYAMPVKSINYTDTLVIHKLVIGHSHIWLVLQHDAWRFVSDMPLCRELKELLIRKVAARFGPQVLTQPLKITGQVSVRSGILLNALLSVLALKKKLP